MTKRFIVFALAYLFLNRLHAEDTPSPLTPEQHMKNGIEAYDNGEYASALAHFGKAELESKELDRVHFNKGRCHFDLKEFDLAIKEFQSAIMTQDPLVKLKSQYNLAHATYQSALVKSTDAGSFEFDEAKLMDSLNFFRDVKRDAAKVPLAGKNEPKELAAQADFNEKLIITRLKAQRDQMQKKKGSKVNFIRGTVQVNQRPIDNALIYMKSKWDETILGQVKSDQSGTFQFKDLEIGKYQFAGSLFPSSDINRLQFAEPATVPAFEKDNQDIKISGVYSLACPYQADHKPLPVPYDDSLRASGPDSIVSSTDWGELTDGRPEDSFPESNDLDPGYVAFAESEFKIAMALPQLQKPQSQQSTTDPGMAPTYQVMLKGYRDEKASSLPSYIKIYGIKKEPPEPQFLHEEIVQSTSIGRYAWQSKAFPQNDFTNLIFEFKRDGGKRISLHEIEVHANDKQEQQKKEDEKKNQEQNQDQKQKQQPKEQEKKEDKEKSNEPSRSTQSILSKVRKKNKEEKDKREVQGGVIMNVERDY